MAIFTVHVPGAAPDLLTQADDTVLVREGFSLRAFVFGICFLLWHRLWIAAAVWVLVLALLAVLGLVIHLPAFVLVGLGGLIHLYLGAEGADLVRMGLARRGLPMRDIVSAPDLDTAEALVFARRPPQAVPVPRPTAPLRASSAMPAVIGLFPDGTTP